MNKRQYLALFMGRSAILVIGAGALPLLPVYAARLGAPPAVAGYYLAFTYLGLTAGKLVGGWLSDQLGRRRALLALVGLLGVPTTWAIGRVNQVWALTFSTSIVWFLGGIGVSLTNILAGLFAGPDERGKVYSFLALAAGVGGLAGGLITGPLADRWGYPAMFALLSLFFLLLPAAAFILRDLRADRALAGPGSVAGSRLRLGKGFYALLAANLIASVAFYVSGLGRSFSMNRLGYSAAAISSTAAVSSAIALPLLPLIGRLSDRLGRKRFLILCYLISAAGLVALSLASSLWHFWIAVALSTFSSTTARAIGPALTNDLLPAESLGRGLGMYSAVESMGAIVGFAGTGHAVQSLGMRPALIAGAVLPLLSILLLVPVRQVEAATEHPGPRLGGDPLA
jgi:MFS family permease